MYEYNVTIIRIIDGDTIEVLADLGFSVHAQVIIRLDRINAPELDDVRGWMSRAYVNKMIADCHQVRIRSRKQEKYGRWLAEVLLQMKSTDTALLNLNDDLVQHGHAVYTDYS